MRFPEFLPENGKIGFIAPSFGCTTEPYKSYFENAKKKFASLGYQIVEGPNCYADFGIGKSNTSDMCAKEINDFFTLDMCDVIISCGGGETMCEDLEFVDFEKIKNSKPKFFMGYSDNTNLTFLLPTLCDIPAIYAPCASSFGMEPWHKSLEDALNVLSGKNLTLTNYDKWELDEDKSYPFAPYNVTEDFKLAIYNKENNNKSAEFSGRLLGGCLDCLNILCGTKYDKVVEFQEKYKEDGIIFFFEACELEPMSVHRVLWQLESASWFKYVKGFLVGRPGKILSEGMGYDRFTSVTSILSKYNVPIIMDLDIGHLPPMMPLICGAYAKVSVEGNSIKIDMNRNK